MLDAPSGAVYHHCKRVSKGRTHTTRLVLGLLVVALLLGRLITWVDTRPAWDDTGVTAGAIFIVTALLGAALPNRAWVWALAVGAWIPVLGAAWHNNYGAVLALVVAFIGAYLGAYGRKAVAALIQVGQATIYGLNA